MRTPVDRLQIDIDELVSFASRTAGRLKILQTNRNHVMLRIACRSAVKSPEAAEPTIDEFEHELMLIIPHDYPSQQVLVRHVRPIDIFHPNIAGGAGLDNPLMRILIMGQVCYSGRHTPQNTLVSVVLQLYDMLGYRSGRFSRSLSDCFCPEAVKWTNQSPGLFPLERRPLTSDGKQGSC